MSFSLASFSCCGRWRRSVAHGVSWRSWTRGSPTSQPASGNCPPRSRWVPTTATAAVRTSRSSLVRSTSSSCWLNSTWLRGWVVLRSKCFLISSISQFTSAEFDAVTSPHVVLLLRKCLPPALTLTRWWLQSWWWTPCLWILVTDSYGWWAQSWPWSSSSALSLPFYCIKSELPWEL